MKRPVKIAIGVVAALGLLFVALLATVSFLFPPARVKAIVLEKAGAALHREVKLDDASIRVFPFLGVSLEGFEIANNPDSGFAKEPLLRLASLDVKLSTMSLFRMAPVVNGIILKEPKIRVEVLADGRTSLDGLGGPKDTTVEKPKTDSVKPLELPFPLSVKRIAIENGSVSWLDRKNGQEVVLGDIDEEISLESDAKLENVASKGRLDLRDVSVSGSGVPVRKGGIRLFLEHDVHLNLPGAVVDIASLKFGVQDLALELSGKASNILVSPVVDLRLRTTSPVDLGKLLAEVPKEISPELSKLALKGAFDMDMTAKGGVAAGQIPSVNGVLHLSSIAASVQGVPAKIEKFGLALHIKNTSTVEIDSTSWLLNGDEGHLLVAVDSLPMGADSLRKPVLRNLDAKGSVDLAALRQVAAPLIPILDTLKPTGRIGWEVKAKGVLDPANPMGLSASGDVKLQAVETSIPGGVKDRLKVDGSVGITNTTANLALALVSGPTDISIKGDAADWMALAMPKLAAGRVAKVNVAVTANTIDVDRFLPPADTTVKPEQASKPLELPKLPPVVLKASFDANLIKVMGLSIQKTQARLSLEGGKAVESIVGSVAKGSIRQNLSADLSDPSRLSAQFAANLSGVQIHDVMIGIKDRIPAGTARNMHDKIFGTGNVAVTASVDGAPAQLADLLAADLKMDLKDGRIEGLPAAQKLGGGMKKAWSGAPSLDPIQFAKFILLAQLRNGRTEIQDMRLDGADIGMIQAKGFVNKDQTLDMKVATHMPESSTGLLQGGAGAVASATGPVASALGVNAGQALPQDEQKRVVLSWLVTGPFASPTVRPDATALTQGAKAAAAAALGAAKAKVEAEAAKVKAEAEAKAKAAVDAKKNEVKTKAQDAIKGKLKGFGL